MKVIFLDVDGVLNCEATFRRRLGGEVAMDANKVMLVAHLCRETRAHVVISSTWRHGNGAMTRLREWLAERGLPRWRIIGRTPTLTTCRGDEIAAWLTTHPVKSFVILDDDNDMGALGKQLVRTTFDIGLTAEHCSQARQLLMETPGQRG